MTSPTLWYLNRGTGVVLIVLLTVTTLLGVLSTGRAFNPLWPRFITQGMHRGIAALTTLLLLVHATVAVVDEFVDIRWWQAILPWGSAFEPFWLGLGTAASDLLVVVVATSVVRSRIPEGVWRWIHWTSYAAWVLAVVHGLGVGTDSSASWSRVVTVACIALFLVAVVVRLTSGLRRTAEDLG